MTAKEFFNNILNGHEDILTRFIKLLKKLDAEYCVIGGLAVNAYVEPVVSLDLDIVILSQKLDMLFDHLKRIFTIEKFPHSYNLCHTKSDLRIQIKTDSRYQTFLKNASLTYVMGYKKEGGIA